MANRTALVTGASSGIGLATARVLAARGYSVGLMARRETLLQKLAAELEGQYPNQKFPIYKIDISDRAEVVGLMSQLKTTFGKLNLLVNNAGGFDYSPFEKESWEKIDAMVNVNVRGTLLVTQLSFDLLYESVRLGEGSHVVNVSSISGLWGFSNMATYSATKFAVTGFTSSLRREWARYKINVAAIHPGPVRSKEGVTRPKKFHEMMPAQIGEQIARLAISNRPRRISHITFAFLNLLEGISPRTVDWILRKII